MGKSNAPQYTTLDNLVPTIQNVVNAYRGDVLKAIAESVDDGAKIFVSEVNKVSPPNDGPGIGGHYRDMWKIQPMRRAKYVKYIGNTKKVKAHVYDKEPSIPLINILEFSPNPDKKRPHVGKALDGSKDQIINLVISYIQKVGK